MITELPPTHFSNFKPEKHLWAAVLASYVDDVVNYAKGKLTADKATNSELQMAYKDFHGEQVTLARLCQYCDLEPEWIANKIKEKLS